MTKSDREQLASLLALLRGLLRQGSAREALSILDGLRAGRAPYDALTQIAQHLRREFEPRPTSPDGVIEDCPLKCSITARECVRRQNKTAQQRPFHKHRGRLDTRKGIAGDHPTCDTRKCALGAFIRANLGRGEEAEWRGAGVNRRFDRKRPDIVDQEKKARKLAAVGLLGLVSTIDGVSAKEEEDAC